MKKKSPNEKRFFAVSTVILAILLPGLRTLTPKTHALRKCLPVRSGKCFVEPLLTLSSIIRFPALRDLFGKGGYDAPLRKPSKHAVDEDKGGEEPQSDNPFVISLATGDPKWEEDEPGPQSRQGRGLFGLGEKQPGAVATAGAAPAAGAIAVIIVVVIVIIIVTGVISIIIITHYYCHYYYHCYCVEHPIIVNLLPRVEGCYCYHY